MKMVPGAKFVILYSLSFMFVRPFHVVFVVYVVVNKTIVLFLEDKFNN